MEESQDSRWKKGQSGNPNGRAAGSRNRATPAIEALLEGEGEALTRKAIELAKAVDMQALRLCLNRLATPRKDSRVAFGYENAHRRGSGYGCPRQGGWAGRADADGGRGAD